MTLIERLRERLKLKFIGNCDCKCQLVPAADVAEAADRIEALEAALRELADCASAIVGADLQDPEAEEAFDMFDEARYRARRALQGKQQ